MIDAAEQEKKIPGHVAIILDGNGRWAKERGLKRSAGHKAGAARVEDIADACIAMGIRYLTVYAFSTENWKRSTEEVSYLMDLMRWYLKNYLSTAVRKGIRMRVIGDRSRLAPDLRDQITEDEVKTAELTNLTLTFAINYGGRDEVVRAVRAMLADRADLTPEDITAEKLNTYMDTAGLPDPDLLIRTGGDKRISNFLLWQSAYSELYFTPKYWPDFTEQDLAEAVKDFAGRERRYGGRNEKAGEDTL